MKVIELRTTAEKLKITGRAELKTKEQLIEAILKCPENDIKKALGLDWWHKHKRLVFYIGLFGGLASIISLLFAVWSQRQFQEVIISLNEKLSSIESRTQNQPVVQKVEEEYEAWNNKGITLAISGKYEEAISAFDKAIELKPDYHEAWGNKGNALDNLGKHKQAISVYNKVIELKPDDHKAYYNKGIAFANLSKYKEAFSDFDKAIELKPDFHQAYNNRGVVLEKLGKHDEALSSYNKAIEIQPNNHKAWLNKALLLEKEAKKAFKKAREIREKIIVK